MDKNKATTIADWFITRANDEEIGGVIEGVTPLKLQKMLYLAQAAHLGLGKGELFEDEILAWKLGPVVESVYRLYKNKRTRIAEPSGNDFQKLNENTISFLEDVWSMFGKYTSFKLVELTHSHSPWKEIEQGKVIPKEKIAEYYKGLFIETNDEA
jgi:uncharacterized phage-associated protein